MVEVSSVFHSRPGILLIDRYTVFLALYPVGIGSEWWLIYGASKVTDSTSLTILFYFFIFLYIPGMSKFQMSGVYANKI